MVCRYGKVLRMFHLFKFTGMNMLYNFKAAAPILEANSRLARRVVARYLVAFQTRAGTVHNIVSGKRNISP